MKQDATDEVDHLVAVDVGNPNNLSRRILLGEALFSVGNRALLAAKVWPSNDLRFVLIATDVEPS